MKINKICLLLLLTFFSCSNQQPILENKIIKKIVLSDSGKEYEISNNKISEITKIFNSRTLTGLPSCPFGSLKIQFETENNEIILFYYAADDCPIFKYDNNYYLISEKSNQKIRGIMRKYNINDHDF